MDFTTCYNRYVQIVNKALDIYINEKDTPEATIYKAMRYSLLAGGKRLRPILALSVCEIAEGDQESILPFACAVEMIHTYSLIHDDLPVMDNDDYRRGRLTNHKIYGEATAILAGDALLNRAFEIMLRSCIEDSNFIDRKVKAMEIIAQASGMSGMIGGQVVDLESEGRNISVERLKYMHKYKTGALIKAPVLSSAIFCDMDEDTVKRLETYADNIGLAFQIKDDILDIEGNSEELGKPTGSDAGKGKTTFITLLGIDQSRKMLNNVTEQAIESLSTLGKGSNFLKELAEYLAVRKN